MELLIGLDNKQWLPAHVEDSWDPDDDMRLMRSVFGHRYMISDGWGRDLLPPDNAPDSQAGAQGGAAAQADAAQKVKLPEYRGWSPAMELWKCWRVGHDRHEGRRLRGTPQNPWSGSRSGGPTHPRGSSSGGAD